MAGTGVRGVELGDVAHDTVVGPTSALKSTAIASSAAASVTTQSPRWAHTSNLAQSEYFCVEESGDKRSSEMQSEHRCNRTHQAVVHLALQVPCHVVTAMFVGSRQKQPAHVSLLQKRRPARQGAWFTLFVHSTAFFPQGVQLNTDVHVLGHGPAAFIHRHWRQGRRHDPVGAQSLCMVRPVPISPDVAQIFPSLHRCPLSIPSTQATTEILLCPASPASCPGFSSLLRAHLLAVQEFRSFLQLPCSTVS